MFFRVRPLNTIEADDEEPVTRRLSASSASGPRLRVPVVVLVGVSDEVAEICWAATTTAGVALVRVAHGIAACREIEDTRPDVVAVGNAVWRDERKTIGAAATAVGASILDIPPFAPPAWLALCIVRAAFGTSGDEDASADDSSRTG